MDFYAIMFPRWALNGNQKMSIGRSIGRLFQWYSDRQGEA